MLVFRILFHFIWYYQFREGNQKWLNYSVRYKGTFFQEPKNWDVDSISPAPRSNYILILMTRIIFRSQMRNKLHNLAGLGSIKRGVALIIATDIKLVTAPLLLCESHVSPSSASGVRVVCRISHNQTHKLYCLKISGRYKYQVRKWLWITDSWWHNIQRFLWVHRFEWYFLKICFQQLFWY